MSGEAETLRPSQASSAVQGDASTPQCKTNQGSFKALSTKRQRKTKERAGMQVDLNSSISNSRIRSRRDSSLRVASRRMSSGEPGRVGRAGRPTVVKQPTADENSSSMRGAIAGYAKNFKEELAMKGVKISFLILPDSSLRWRIDVLLMASTLYTAMFIPFLVAFEPDLISAPLFFYDQCALHNALHGLSLIHI